MAEVKWIKLATDMFDNRKIRQIECLPDGDAIIVIWVKLLCLSGNINNSGLVYFTREIPYTDQMLAAQFNRPLTTVQMALKTFEQFGMIEVIDNVLHISNWEKYQSVDRLAEIREYNRLAKQKSREKQKLLAHVNDKSMTSQPCQGTDIDKEEDIDKEIEKDNENDNEDSYHDSYNDSHNDSSSNRSEKVSEVTKSAIDYLNKRAGTAYKATSEKTKKLVSARMNEGFTEEDFQTVIDNKVDEWGKPPKAGEKDMRPFIRPETLFGTKFEAYLNQRRVVNDGEHERIGEHLI